MATDPVQQIAQQQFETPFADDLPEILRRLAALPPSTEVPYLTLTLDWQPQGSQPDLRPARDFFDVEAEAALAALHPHRPPHTSLSQDVARIAAYLDGEVPAAVQGLVIVASAANGVFEAVPLGLPLANRFSLAPTPSLRTLAGLAEDDLPFALLTADQQSATLAVIDQTARRRQVGIEATGYPRKQMQGGWSQRRYQQRADERVEAFARIVAEETRKALDETGVDLLVLAGNEQITTLLTDAFHPTVRDCVVGTIRFDPHGVDADVVAAALPVVERAERARETATVRRVQEGAGPGGGAVTGPVETLTALQAGQVMTLVMNDDFAAPGWADYTLPLWGLGDAPSEHPAGGDVANLVPVALEEEMVRLALQSAAEIEMVRATPPVGADEQPGDGTPAGERPRTEAARMLDDIGGVAAILRFVLDDRQSTARM